MACSTSAWPYSWLGLTNKTIQEQQELNALLYVLVRIYLTIYTKTVDIEWKLKILFQFLSLFYICLALLLVGTNLGCRKRRGEKQRGGKLEMVQYVEGKDIKCEVLGDKEDITCTEDRV